MLAQPLAADHDDDFYRLADDAPQHRLDVRQKFALDPLLSEAIGDPQHQAVLVITAYATVENAVEAFKAGAFDYLVKPVLFEDLLTKQRKTLVTAESCTGGLLGKMIVDVAGSSSYVVTSLASSPNRGNSISNGHSSPEETTEIKGATASMNPGSSRYSY
jgi:DNA-binding response OmpR family regulator